MGLCLFLLDYLGTVLLSIIASHGTIYQSLSIHPEARSQCSFTWMDVVNRQTAWMLLVDIDVQRCYTFCTSRWLILFRLGEEARYTMSIIVVRQYSSD
jgi:hypothetical protein